MRIQMPRSSGGPGAVRALSCDVVPSGNLKHDSGRNAWIGTAGWSIGRRHASEFPGPGSHLARYARQLRAVEINSSFYRDHSRATYERWAGEAPGLRFAVKMPRAITHEHGLQRASSLVRKFIDQIAGLGAALGPILVQLPPSLVYEGQVAARFFGHLRDHFAGAVMCEPRHATWAAPNATRLMVRWRIGRVAADPPRVALRELPAGWLGPTGDGRHATVYYRLHGSPRVYWSSYANEALANLVAALQAWPPATDVWCIFDNTAAGAALDNARAVHRLLDRPRHIRDRGSALLSS
jgi:uncharacterized protein YecE (DUF72 family)